MIIAEPMEVQALESSAQLRVAAPSEISIKEPVVKPALIGGAQIMPNLFPKWIAGTFTCEKIQIIKPADPIPSCNDPKVYDASRKDCVCKPGYYAEAIGTISVKPVIAEEIKVADSKTLAARTAAPEAISIKPSIGVVDSISKPNYIVGKSFTCKQNISIKPAPISDPVINVKPLEPVINVKPLEPVTTKPVYKPAPVTESAVINVKPSVLSPIKDTASPVQGGNNKISN